MLFGRYSLAKYLYQFYYFNTDVIYDITLGSITLSKMPLLMEIMVNLIFLHTRLNADIIRYALTLEHYIALASLCSTNAEMLKPSTNVLHYNNCKFPFSNH